jgi:hypothetical protein
MTAILACSDFYVQFPDTNNNNNTLENRITITVNGSLCDEYMNMNPTKNGGSHFITGNSRKPPSLTSLYGKLVLGKNMIWYSFVNNTSNQVLGINQGGGRKTLACQNDDAWSLCDPSCGYFINL